MRKKTPPCPNCKSKDVAWYFYGYPADMEWYLQAKKEGKIRGGGCSVSYDDPKWACNSCGHNWGGDKLPENLFGGKNNHD